MVAITDRVSPFCSTSSAARGASPFDTAGSRVVRTSTLSRAASSGRIRVTTPAISAGANRRTLGSRSIRSPVSSVAPIGRRVSPIRATPSENRLDELWSQLNFVNPGLLGARRDFAVRWEQPIIDGDKAALTRLRTRIKPFVLRRKKVDVAPELPPRTEDVLWEPLDDDERAGRDVRDVGDSAPA